MIFTDIMKNMMIYRKPLFLPTLEDDKKKGSSVLLMTPNYESSKRLMQHPLLINRLRYQSYYAERNLTKFISSKVLDRVEEASFDEGDILQEKYLKNDSDIYYNKEKFDKGDINLCFITGHSGSGKSTMGRNLSKENVEHYGLDDVLANKLRFTMGELEEYGDLIYSFFNGVGKKYYFTGEEEKTSQSPELNSIYYNGENYDEDITNDFVNYAIHYAESHKNAKFVIEGIWLYKYTNPSKLLDYAVCIKGTSAIVSAIRGLRRDIATDKSNGESPGLIERLRMIKAYTKRALIDEKKIEKWRKLFISKINESIETLLEATKYPEDIPEDIIQFSKELNKKYRYGVIFNGKPVANLDNFDFWDDYKSLSVSEFEKYKIGVCWDFVHYEAKWFKEHGYKYETYYVEAEDKDNDLPTHSFLVFYLPNSSKVYYFESSWGRYKGIEEFNNISTLLQTITKRHVEENEADLKSAFYVKYDASSSSLEHIGCGEYMKKASKGKTMLQEGAANRVSKFDWNVSGDKPPYHPVPIEKEYGIMAENRYNAIIKLKGYKPLRGRSEVLIVNDMDQVYLTKGKWGPYDYELPGGSWDKGEDHMQCVIREAMEEARIKIKDVEEYLPYVATYEPDDWQNEHIPKAMQWYGDYNQLYIAKYDGYYDGPVEKEDKENKMLRKGRFYDIKEVEKLLDPGHLTAICAYLYQGLGDKFIEDTLNAQDLVQKGTINETVMKSTIDKDFQKKGSKKLNWKQKAIAPMEYFIYRIKKEGVIDVYRNYFGNLVASAQQESFLFEKMDILQEDSKYDSQLKRLFYNDRIRQRKEIIELNKQVKIDMPFIKYIYIEPEKYKEKNLFVDYSYYNDIFFKNNDWDKKKGYELYTDLMERIFTDPMIKKLGYKKRTIFIPVLDWKREAGNVWSYRESINPISVFYELMRTNSDKLKMFGDTDIVFFGKDKYFKINFSQIEEEPRKLAFKYKMFVGKILAGQEFDLDDIDTSSESKESPKAIKANIIDKIEASKGVDLTGKDTVHGKMVPPEAITGHSIDKKSSVTTNVEKELSDKTLVKGKNTDELRKKEKDLQQLAKDIDRISQDAEDTEDAIDHMEDLKSIIIDLDSMGNDSAKVDPARAARMNKLDQQFLEKQVKGKTIRDILSEDPTKKELETTSLDIASPNEEWKTMTYMNFDKDYDLNRDILACLKHFQTVSNPISIRNIDVKNNSTSEDRVDLYTAEMEDSRGKRFSMKLDIPIMIDNRFLLRGNDKKINTQFCNMPIIKTDLDAAQIITNYQKVFIYRVNTVSGRSHPFAGRLLKAINKYKGKNLKLYYGDNGKICNKYELSVDYIDMASVLNKIETPTYIIYFNQDEIRRDYPNIDDSLGVPFAISKKDKQVKYFSIDRYGQMTFAATLFYEYLSEDEELKELFNKATEPTSGTYSRCNIMSSKIPMIVVLGYMEGLTKTLKKANINYQLVESLTKEIREQKNIKSWIRFKDGYLVYESTYTACMLLNGFKECSTDIYSIYDVDNKNTYLEMLDNFGGRIKADGLDNFYDCLVDPISKEVLEHYNLPTDVVSIFLYANMLLSDNKFTKHTDVSSRRIRRNEMVAAYAYEALSESYGSYANQMKHNKSNAEFIIKQSAVIDKLLASPISSDDSTINGLEAVEATNAITYKGKSGLNSERSYSLDKRTYDDSMINVLGASTGFSGNTGITRQTTIDMNVEGVRGYIRTTDGDISKMNASKTLTATEAVTPFGSTRDDGMRTAMTFIQTAKHTLRTEQSDPLLVTTGADEALAYLTTDKFAFKAKKNGKIKELTEEYIIIGYDDGTNDYVNLKETVEKNSDAGCYVPLKLDAIEGLRIGKKIKQNEILAYDKLSFSNSVGETDNIAYNIGKLAKVAIINTDEGYEDSGVTIETMSEKLASRIIVCEDRVIDKDATIFSMVNVGDEVDVNDALLVWQDPYEEEDANILLKSLANDQEQVSELGRRTIRSEVAGKISDIRISRTVELEELSDSLRKIVNNYEKKIKTLKKKLDSEGIDSTHLPATYKLEPTGKLKNAQDAVKIEIFVEYRDIIAVGDKVTYYSANKAVTKAIIPKELAPYTSLRPNEPVDAFVSEVSIDKRMVGSTMSYGSIQKLMIELDRTVKDMAGIPYDDSKV